MCEGQNVAHAESSVVLGYKKRRIWCAYTIHAIFKKMVGWLFIIAFTNRLAMGNESIIPAKPIQREREREVRELLPPFL